MKTITDMDVSGKRVLCRVDFNVPLDDDRRITDDSRIRAALPTLRHVMESGGKLIVASHLGRPKGERVEKFSLAPVGRRLEELLGKEVIMAPDCVGPEVADLIGRMTPGQVVLLENLRFHGSEAANDDTFGRELARLCDIYVNDAFAVCHRENASVAAVVPHAPQSAAGLLLKRELEYFEKAMARPRRPLAAVVGGAKVSSKLGALTNMLRHVDKVIIGGAMANTFLKARGVAVGTSKIEEELIDAAAGMMKQAEERGIRFYLPVDAVVADAFDVGANTLTVPVQEIPDGWMMLDIGPATAIVYGQALKDAETIVWNGPMGVFEMAPFSAGTMNLAGSIAESKGLTIVGGGDTDAALHMAGKTDKVSYISTGGGAFLALLEGKTLPAVAALEAAP